VPPFQDSEVDQYFLHFKKVASSLEWPKEVWTLLLLQSALIGKAHEVCSALSESQSSDYKVIKGAILRGLLPAISWLSQTGAVDLCGVC